MVCKSGPGDGMLLNGGTTSLAVERTGRDLSQPYMTEMRMIELLYLYYSYEKQYISIVAVSQIPEYISIPQPCICV